MDKLQYDSFYKFMVSAGVVLVAAPLVGLYYILCNGNQILISQAEYDALSLTSIQFLNQRDKTILYVLKALPWLLGSLIIIGLICLIYGGIKWHNIQKEIDEQTKLKTREQEANLRKLTTSEIAVKVIDEVANDCENQENSTEIINNTMLRRHTVVKAIEIEDLCYSYISKKYSMDYDIHQNIRINNHDCDIIAISKKNKIDYLFEVKYWNKIPSSALLLRAMTLIDELNISYESNSNRKCKCVLMIVTIDEIKEKLKEFCDLYASKYSAPIDIKIYKESDLK